MVTNILGEYRITVSRNISALLSDDADSCSERHSMNLHHCENLRFCNVHVCCILLVESLDSVAELPTAVGQQLQHLVKGRPRRAKTRAPSRPMLRSAEIIEDVQDLGEGLDTFFRPGSVTPTGTPLVSPTSDDRYHCALSFSYHSFLSS